MNSLLMKRRAFTMVELLVILGILAILIALILPALFNAKESSRAAVCASNQHQITAAFIQFATDHNGCLPGNQWDSIYQTPNAPSWQHDWMLGNNVYQYANPVNNATEIQQMMQGPQSGTIYPYLYPGSNASTTTIIPKVYLCPSYWVGAPLQSGIGSNGRFDYTSFIVFAGAKVGSISPKARFHYSSTNPAAPATAVTLVGTGGLIDQSVFTPLIDEEEPNGGVNGVNMEAGHCNTDRLGHAHFGGANYSSVDGSVHRFSEQQNQNAWSWEAIAPSGKWTSLGSVPSPGWGWWQRQ